MRLLTSPSLLIATLALPILLSAAAPNDDSEVAIKLRTSITPEEVAALLGGYLWNFELNMPRGTTEVSVELEASDKGQKPHTLCGSTTDRVSEPGETRDLLVAIVPINGAITDAQMLRVSIVMSAKSGDGSKTLSTFAGEAANPFRKLTFTQTQLMPQRLEKGTYQLIAGGGGDNATLRSPVAEQEILLKIETK